MRHSRSTAVKPVQPTYKGVAKGKVVHLQGGASLPKGTTVTVLVDEPIKGSPAAVLQALRRMPRVRPDLIDEMDRMIEEGKLPVRTEGIFDERRGRRR